MHRRYKSPAVVEVVCEFRFVPSEPWDLAVPGLIYDRLRKDLPTRRPVRRLETSDRRQGDQLSHEIRVRPVIRFLSRDEKRFAQVGPDLLSVNHLAPYPGWGEYCPLIESCYSAYGQVANPKGLSRIGLRYINHIEFPEERGNMKQYFQFLPYLGPELPKLYGSFRVGVDFPLGPDNRDVLRLQLGSSKPGEEGRSAVALDLDYYLVQPEAVSTDDALHWVEDAHVALREVFEASITDRLRERLEILEG